MRTWCLLSGLGVLVVLGGCDSSEPNSVTLVCCVDPISGEVEIFEDECRLGEQRGPAEAAGEDDVDSLRASICGDTCCIGDDGSLELRGDGPCEPGEGTAFEAAVCQTGCCREPDGTLNSGGIDGCLPGSEILPREVCDSVCCQRDDEQSLQSLFDCLRDDDVSPAVALPAEECEPEPDGGAPAPDAGAPEPDAGAPDLDAGVPGPDAIVSGGEQCTCNDDGVQFEIVSGCEGGGFADALEPSFCRSAVEFGIMADPDSHLFNDGATFGFDDCQVRINCP